MITFKLVIEYDGTRYSGWQDQKNSRTVMGELRKAATQVFAGKFEMQGAGRTDAGVHALGQVMHLQVESEVREKPAELQKKCEGAKKLRRSVLRLRSAVVRPRELSTAYLCD